MKRIVSLSLGRSAESFERTLTRKGEQIRISHFGVDFNPDLLLRLAQEYDGACDVLAISGLPQMLKIRKQEHRHVLEQQLRVRVQESMLTWGQELRSVYATQVIDKALRSGQLPFPKRSLCFVSGLAQRPLAQVLEASCHEISFLDPYVHFKTPLALNGFKNLEKYTARMLPLLKKRSLKESKRLISLKDEKAFSFLRKPLAADYIVASPRLLGRIDPQTLQGKSLILDEMDEGSVEFLRASPVHNAWFVSMGGEEQLKNLPLAVIEGLIYLEKGGVEPVSEDDILRSMVEWGLKPKLQALYPERLGPVRKYAFIIHPLSRRDIFLHPLVKPLERLPEPLGRRLEKAMAAIPSVPYGRVSGSVSEHDGTRVEGLLYTLFATPREMLAADPETVYRQLVKTAELAAAEGAEIIGLGAFTKIVGDAGVTVAKRSPIPVTTGNSLSAAATLWAAREACEKLGLIPLLEGSPQKNAAQVMIIGATGSIGQVCARILAKIFKTVVLTANNGSRLLSLRDELLRDNPGTEILVTTKNERYAPSSHLIIIATSAAESGFFRIESVRPGAVVCDVGRPLAFTADEACKRPDVLLIESGEIELPGQVSLSCNIGLEDAVVYACLAETALLALDGRFESFTLSRKIEHEKVSEIYKIARKHGARLAAIRSPNGVVTDQEIALCRAHALRALADWEAP